MDSPQDALGGGADAFKSGKIFRPCPNHIGKAAKVGDEGFGQWLDIRTRQGGEQQQLQKFIIRHALPIRVQKTLAQTLPVAVVMGGGGVICIRHDPSRLG